VVSPFVDLIGRSNILAFASHNLEMPRMIRAMLLESGTIVATGSVDELVHR